MSDLIRQGKTTHWGLSEATEDIIREAHKVCPVTAIQNRYSMMYRHFPGTRKPERLRGNAGAANIRLISQEVQALDDLNGMEISGAFGGTMVKKQEG